MRLSEAKQVGVIMGSDSDLPIMKAACEMLDEFSVSYEVSIVSAHRTPDRLVTYAQSARKRGIQVIIAGAGGAAHLPGMVAAMTTLPVIGVPVKTSALSGLDSLYSIVQMPKGVPVATVAIGNAANAAILATRILACGTSTQANELSDKLAAYADKQRTSVIEKDQSLQQQGYQAYLSKDNAPSSTTVM
uniref:phosphoribosylaminoimidazole carboxylase n=1 Tax=Aureoumbra lagunensis TaxID=44058 RepID=A0A7S3JXF7_9STRA|mmetsp:Transcript_2736/g.3766  ORF Transcript_2736/g.3766 Transcript_2736/m.3766 type:complete len:189 (-) Transcript_2736:278-844(-)